MSPPIRDGSGNDIGAIRLGDGTEISEVRTGAGDVLFTPTTPAPPSAIARYEFENDVTDSFNNNDATDNTSAGFVTGEVGSFAKDFDGSDDEVVLPFQLDSSNDFSVIGFVNFDVVGANDNPDHIVGGRDNFSTTDFVLRQNGGAYQLAVGEGFDVTKLFTQSFPTGSYFHFALTKGGNTYTVYHNGASLGTLTTSQGWTTSEALTVGSTESGTADALDGSVDHLDFYSKELSGTEVSNHRSTGSI